MKSLIWGCTQMIVGMLGVIASILMMIFWLQCNAGGFALATYVILILFAAMVVIGYVNRVWPVLTEMKNQDSE